MSEGSAEDFGILFSILTHKGIADLRGQAKFKFERWLCCLR